ncbi:hypothetical protein ACFZCP_35200 [Streptomyces sp. NPDC007971]|uniref:hypothetical protein n=1 Tax=Streptomyces sp. NPDC007971 TaxID=3364799 RepID=UPI0036E5F198
MSRRKGCGKPWKAAGARGAARQRLVDSFARTTPGGVKVLVVSDYTPGDSPWVDSWAEWLLADDVPRCEHLSRRPGAGFLNGSERYGRCLDCHTEHAASEAVRGLLDGGRIAKCGRCEAAVVPALLRPVAVELGPWVLVSALCPVCATVLLHEGQSGQGLAAVGGGR